MQQHFHPVEAVVSTSLQVLQGGVVEALWVDRLAFVGVDAADLFQCRAMAQTHQPHDRVPEGHGVRGPVLDACKPQAP